MSTFRTPPAWRLPEGVDPPLWQYTHTPRLAAEEDAYFSDHPLFRTDARILDEQRASEIVVGLPLEAAGHEGSQARVTRDWVEAVQPLLEAPLRYRDERLTSHLAEERLGPMKRGRSGGPPSRTQRDAWRARVDREAAAIILQDELDALAGVPASATRTEPADAPPPRDVDHSPRVDHS